MSDIRNHTLRYVYCIHITNILTHKNNSQNQHYVKEIGIHPENL